MKNLVIKHKWVLLTVMICLLFINWYHYPHNMSAFQAEISHFLFRLIDDNFWLIGKENPKLLTLAAGFCAYILLLIPNIGISASVIWIYFEGESSSVKLLVQFIIIYIMIISLFVIVAFLMKEDALYRQFKDALSFVSSPLLECVSIPVLLLYRKHEEE